MKDRCEACNYSDNGWCDCQCHRPPLEPTCKGMADLPKPLTPDELDDEDEASSPEEEIR